MKRQLCHRGSVLGCAAEKVLIAPHILAGAAGQFAAVTQRVHRFDFVKKYTHTSLPPHGQTGSIVEMDRGLD